METVVFIFMAIAICIFGNGFICGFEVGVAHRKKRK